MSKDKKIQEIQNQICKLNKKLITLKKENQKNYQKVNYSENIKNEKYLNPKVDDENKWKRLIIPSIILIGVGIAFLAIGLTVPPVGIGIVTAMGSFISVPIIGIGLGVPLFIWSSFKTVSNFFKTKINKKNEKINDIKNSKKQKIEHIFKNTNLNVQEINSLDLQNQSLTSEYKPNLPKM